MRQGEDMVNNEVAELLSENLDIIFELFKNMNSPYEGFRMRDLHILTYIDGNHDNHKVTITELAYHLKVTPAAASQLVSGYEKKNWLIRTRSKADRRTVYIELTPELREAVKARKVAIINKVMEGCDQFTDQELSNYAKVARLMNQNLKNN
jgi:DNA-binding MarR family transcriptional regulator